MRSRRFCLQAELHAGQLTWPKMRLTEGTDTVGHDLSVADLIAGLRAVTGAQGPQEAFLHGVAAFIDQLAIKRIGEEAYRCAKIISIDAVWYERKILLNHLILLVRRNSIWEGTEYSDIGTVMGLVGIMEDVLPRHESFEQVFGKLIDTLTERHYDRQLS